MVDLWAVDSHTFGPRKANDIERPEFAAFVPLRKSGGISLLRASLIGGRLVFLRHATDKRAGLAITEWNDPPLRNARV
jgi:hypothetical protein